MSAHHTDNDFGADNVASKPGDRPHHLAVRQRPIAQRVTERRPGERVATRQQRSSASVDTSTRQPEPGGLRAEPTARLLARRLRQVLRVVLRRRRSRRRRTASSPAS